MSLSSPRSLAEWLRAQPDRVLADLLRARPDLAVPTPSDVATLASRASVRFSVLRALEDLDTFTLHALEAIVLLASGRAGDGPQPSYAAVRKLLTTDPAQVSPDSVQAAVDRLRVRALIWGEQDAMHVPGPVRDALGSYPAGLGRPAATLFTGAPTATLTPVLEALGLADCRQPEAGAAIAAAFADPDRLRELLARCGKREREVLGQLASGLPVGTVRDAARPVSARAAETPVRWLLAHGLLVAIDQDTVELPREVGLAIRGDHPLGPLQVLPPPLAVADVGASAADGGGAGQVLAVLRHAETLADSFAADPPSELRAGGLGVRDLRRTARALGVDEPVAGLFLEVLRAAGLLASTGGPEPTWLPTPQYDEWRNRLPARRWTMLAAAWLGMTRLPSLIGQRDDRGRALAPLSADLDRSTAPRSRRAALGVLADLPPGTAPSDSDQVSGRLAWRAPRRGTGQQPEVIAAVLDEAEVLGITGRRALTSYGRVLLAAGDPGAAGHSGPGMAGTGMGGSAMAGLGMTASGTGGLGTAGTDADPAHVLAGLLPEPVDYMLVQADLTVVAPGPLDTDLAHELALVADVESAGGATVYRVTEGTVRRALDAGRTAVDLQELFRSRSRTPVPQALTYLIDDVARRHGVLRAGSSASYLRCDDEALLAEVTADRRAEPLGLRRVAPTVVVSRSPVKHVLEVLRHAGYAPVAEAPNGVVVVTRPEARRAPPRPPQVRPLLEPPVLEETQLVELVRTIRSGDRALRQSVRGRDVIGPGDIPGVTTAAVLGLLRKAAREGRPVWLGYVNAEGTGSERIVEPVSVSGGYLHGYDHKRDEMRTFSLHRITGAALVDDEKSPSPGPDGDHPAG